MSLKRAFCITIFIMPCCIIGIIGYAIHSLSFLSGCDESKPEQIEDLAQFKLPPSYRNLKSFCVGMQGYGADASFEMNPSELNAFITTTKVSLPLFNETSPDIKISNDGLNKKASQMDSYLYGKYETFEFTQEILIDTSDSKRYVVHIIASGG